MRIRKQALFSALTALTLMSASSAAVAQEVMDRPVMLTPEEIEWKPGPDSLPPGSLYAILEGDPSQPEMVTMRLAFPPNYELMPHTHSGFERVTVLAGTLYFGPGDEMNPAMAKELPAGSFFLFPPDTPMFGFTGDQETVIQLNVEGPWEITYLNPADDPRN